MSHRDMIIYKLEAVKRNTITLGTNISRVIQFVALKRGGLLHKLPLGEVSLVSYGKLQFIYVHIIYCYDNSFNSINNTSHCAYANGHGLLMM